MSQMIQHYQTSFTIRGGGLGVDDKLLQAMQVIGEWVKDHENNRRRKYGREHGFMIDGGFTHRCRYASLDSWCKTEYCIMEKSKAWILEYKHRDSSEYTVYWVSEIGFEAFSETDSLVVHVRISYEISTECAMGGNEPHFNLSVPWFFNALLSLFQKSGAEFYSGGRNVTSALKQPFVPASREEVLELVDYIESPDRKMAVVLLLGELPDVVEEARYLNEKLFAKGLVYVIPYRPDLFGLLKKYKIAFGECRILFPFRRFGMNPTRHPLYYVDQKKSYTTMRDRMLRSWVAVHSISEWGSVRDVEGVRLLLRQQIAENLKKELKGKVSDEEYQRISQQLSEVTFEKALYEESNTEMAKAIKEKDDALKEKDEAIKGLRDENVEKDKQYRTDIYNLKAQHESVRLQRDTAESVIPRQYPGSFDAFRSFEKCYRHLCFAPCAWERAAEYRQFANFEILWEILHDLDNVLWKMVFEEDVVNLDSEYKHRTGYDYAASEGPATKNDPKLARLRQFEFEGRQYEMWSHIKHGNRKGDQLRVHFAIDRDNRRIVIGWIGDHMDNATTRSIH